LPKAGWAAVPGGYLVAGAALVGVFVGFLWCFFALVVFFFAGLAGCVCACPLDGVAGAAGA